MPIFRQRVLASELGGDSRSKKVRELLSVAPNEFGGVTISRDDGQLYFSLATTEADICLMTLE